jgi:hypothetical protein
MTERQWFTVVDPDSMLLWVGPRCPERKLRLFAVACCRHVAHLCRDRFESALTEAEVFADGPARSRARGPVTRRAALWMTRDESALAHALSERRGRDAAAAASERAVAIAQARGGGWAAEKWFQAASLCDVVGNPFRPPPWDPVWAPPTVVQLARQMYESRDFSGMPVLADALQEAGCEDEPVLAHCRDPHGVHVRGCWVVDLVLGKS